MTTAHARARARDRTNLGISAKSVVPLAPELARKRQRDRAALTVAAGSILYDPVKPKEEQHRTCWCNRGIKSNREDAGVYRRLDGGGARFSNMVMCGVVHTCPTCAAPIQERRRVELNAGMVRAQAMGLHAYLLTGTFPHERGEPLAELLDRFDRARKTFKQSKVWRELKSTWGAVGSVCAHETTWGPNGWHPHVHILVFAKPGLLADARFVARLNAAWVSAITAAGLVPHAKITWAMEHAFDIRGGDRAAEYVAKFGRDEKWGMSSEMTRHAAKIGARGGLADFDGHVTPFQVLAWAKEGDGTAWELFREFAQAYHGRRQLTWSPGLKKLFGVAELTDEQIASTPAPDEVQVGCITDDQLVVLVQRRAVPEFLSWVAEFGDSQGDIDDYIAHVAQSPPTAKPWITRQGVTLTYPTLEKEAA